MKLPDEDEKISLSMPIFWKGNNLIHFAFFKKHIGLYPRDEVTAVFAEKPAYFEANKEMIPLPYDQDLPEKLIADIAKWCYASCTR